MARQKFILASLFVRNILPLYISAAGNLSILLWPMDCVLLLHRRRRTTTMLSFHAIWFYRSRLELFTMEAVVGGDNARWTFLGLHRTQCWNFFFFSLSCLWGRRGENIVKGTFTRSHLISSFHPHASVGHILVGGSKSYRSEVVPSWGRIHGEGSSRDMFRILVPLLFLICLSFYSTGPAESNPNSS